MIVLFKDSSVNYWLDNSVVNCGNVDAPNSNPEIVFPPDYDYDIKELDEIEKKISDKKKYNNTTNVLNNSIEDACLKGDPQEGYRINTKTNNKKFKPVYYINDNDNTSNYSIKDARLTTEGYKKKYNNKTNNKKFKPVYYHE
jgi:hypothetical protein